MFTLGVQEFVIFDRDAGYDYFSRVSGTIKKVLTRTPQNPPTIPGQRRKNNVQKLCAYIMVR